MSNLKTLLQDSKIVIPPIQRDYAQGRNTGKIPTIRSRFIESIYEALTNDNEPVLELDFIYGYNEIDTRNNEQVSVFKPLDGQQRLTTLFLIHWFIANKENRIEEATPLLTNFSYATRETSRLFCNKLIGFKINWTTGKKVDEQIINQPWFFATWKNDPTIQSMLVVLRAIHLKFQDVNNLWDKLTGEHPKIVFHLLSMNNLGLPDDLYIKMNARGKALTEFEHFKSSFSELLNAEQAKYFNDKIDGEWSDLFWNIFKDNEQEDIAKLVDAGFLSFFWYITDILTIKNKIIVLDDFWLNKIKLVYQNNPENIQFLFSCIDLFLNFSKLESNPFLDIFYVSDEEFAVSKTKLFFKNANPNLFQKCVQNYSQGGFVIREQLLLYAFIYIKLNNKEVPENFYRLMRNLLENASDKEIRYDNLMNLYSGIEAFILGERQPEKLPFTKRQLSEENDKLYLIKNDPSLKETIYKLEDHTMFRGAIGIFNLDGSIMELGNTFLSIFYQGQNYFEVSRAMLTFGLYPQSYGNEYLRFGNKNNSTWREIFTQSDNRKNFDRTKGVLKEYLIYKKDNVGIDNKMIVQSYLDNFKNKKSFSYYYLKYISFILWKENHNEHQTEGYYWWKDFAERPYECTMLFRSNFRGRSWSPFLLELSLIVEECDIENYSARLQFTKDKLILLIENLNEGFKFSAPEGEIFSELFLDGLIANNILDENGCLLIEQDQDGVDLIDRIEKCAYFLNNLAIEK
jgi:hypothetical protein